MKSILDELFYGNISPRAKKMLKDSKYQKELKVLSETESKLLNSLNDEQKELLISLMNKCTDIQGLVGKEYYKEGISFGVQLMAEVFYKETLNLTDIEK